MEHTKEEKVEVLRKRLKEMEEEQEQIKCKERQILQEEQEEDMAISYTHAMLERMSGCCTSEDIQIQQIIEEQQYYLREFRKRKLEFDEEFHQEMKRKKQKIEMDMEECYWNISCIRNEEENNETEEKDR